LFFLFFLAHFVSRSLYRNRALGPVNEKVYTIAKDGLNVSFSMTVLTDVSNNMVPLFIDIREQSNTQWDFVRFVMSAIQCGYLRPGDFLVVDNASIHSGTDSWDFLNFILDIAEVSLKFLPTYSPEFNPCELVFSYIKNDLRLHRKLDDDLVPAILRAMIRLTRVHVLKCYLHCICVSLILFNLFPD
jgi:transposase